MELKIFQRVKVFGPSFLGGPRRVGDFLGERVMLIFVVGQSAIEMLGVLGQITSMYHCGLGYH